MYTSGVEVPPLGSYKDRVLRKFMDLETQRKLKAEQLNLAVALLSCSTEKAKKSVTSIWKDLVSLEFGVYDQEVDMKSSTDKAWIEEFERMKANQIRLVRKNGSLVVEGLKSIVE